mgnify:CR=1 FL=1
MKEIHSISEYLECLGNPIDIRMHTNTVGSWSLYRGQANVEWELAPSLYRKGLFGLESLLLTELMHIAPSEFSGDRFDILVKMQHYGMPTRLLDTTTNPLVALFFACYEKKEREHDGVVYVFPHLPVSWSTDPLIKLIMDYVFEYQPKRIWLDKFLEISKEKYHAVPHRLMPNDIHSMLHYLTIPAFAVMPAKANERINAQDGAFLVFGMKLEGKEVSTNEGTLGRVYYNFEPAKISPTDKILSNDDSILIPAMYKEKILKQLDTIGINVYKLFPDLSHKIEHIVNTVPYQIYEQVYG